VRIEYGKPLFSDHLPLGLFSDWTVIWIRRFAFRLDDSHRKISVEGGGTSGLNTDSLGGLVGLGVEDVVGNGQGGYRSKTGKK